MKLRLQGTPAECAKVCFLLRYGPPDLEVVEVSPPYPNRGDSRQVRVYLEARCRRSTRWSTGPSTASPLPTAHRC